MEAFITALVERIPNEDTFLGMRGKFSLVGAEAIDKNCTSKNTERDIRYKASGGGGIR